MMTLSFRVLKQKNLVTFQIKMSIYNLKEKSALVTGASSGIGLGISKSLAKEGVNLLLISRNEKNLSKVVRGLRSEFKIKIDFLPGDVNDSETLQKAKSIMSSKFGGCDILVNNAGGPPMGSFLDFSNTDWDKAFRQNFLSTISFSKEFYPEMKKKKWGRIINISSTLAKEPTSQMVLSASMRAGVSAFTKAVSSEMAPHGVTINTICPGGVLTQRMKDLVEQSAKNQNKTYKEVLKENTKLIPIGRFASPDEFSKIILFLISDEASYLTGLSLMADGGLTKSIF